MNYDDLTAKGFYQQPDGSWSKRPPVQARAALPDTEQRKRPEALARSDAGEASRPGLRHCRFTLHRRKLLDVDAKYSSVKDLLDCLAIAHVVDGDKEGQITLEVNQVRCGKGEPETTVIEVFKQTPCQTAGQSEDWQK